MVNYNAYVHSTKAFGGKPKRYREIAADFDGYIGELLAKATGQDKLDGAITKDEKDGLLQVLRFWGALDKNYEYKKSEWPATCAASTPIRAAGLSRCRSIPIRCR